MLAIIVVVFLPNTVAQAQTITGLVTHVIDGDTFRMNQTRIRICGIDAPEMGSGRGMEAKLELMSLINQRLISCIPVGGGTVCDKKSKTINRNRVVAQCFLGNRDLAREMVQAGHACAWPKFSGRAYLPGCVRQ